MHSIRHLPLCAAGLGLALCVTARSATAATISYTGDFSEAVVAAAPPDVADQPTPFSVDLPQFDPALGTLNEVLFESVFDFEIEVSVAAGGTGEAHPSVGGAYSVDGIQFTGFGNGTFAGGSADESGPAVFSASFSVPVTIALTPTFRAEAFNAFIGTGLATLLFAAQADLSTTGDVTMAELRVLDSSFIRVTYDYTAAVPEPGSLALVGLGLVGLCAAARRSRPRKA